jgi:hypothetical protein
MRSTCVCVRGCVCVCVREREREREREDRGWVPLVERQSDLWYLIDVENTIRSNFKLHIRVVDWRSVVGLHQEKSQSQWMVKVYNLGKH